MARRGSAQHKLDQVVDLIADKMDSDVCSIYLLRDNNLELYATHGLRKEAVHVTRLKMGEGLVGTIAAEGRVLNLAEAAEHPAFLYKPETGEERYHSFAGVPIVRLESPIGVLAVQHAEPRRYEDVEVEARPSTAGLPPRPQSNVFSSAPEPACVRSTIRCCRSGCTTLRTCPTACSASSRAAWAPPHKPASPTTQS